jgi:hypothetical protein
MLKSTFSKTGAHNFALTKLMTKLTNLITKLTNLITNQLHLGLQTKKVWAEGEKLLWHASVTFRN